MDRDHASPPGALRCRGCGAENLHDAVHCHRCLRHDWRDEDDDFAPPFPIRFAAARTIIVLIGLIALAIILWPRSPMATIILLAIVVPALLASEIQALRDQRWGTPISGRERLLTIFKYVLVLTPIVLAVTLAAVVLRVAEFIAGGAYLPP
jgi:hypothetical protein